MEITEVTKADRVDAMVIEVSGRLDSVTTGQFRERLAPLVRSAIAGSKNIVLDFAQVDYVSSWGHRALFLIVKECRPTDLRVMIASLQPLVQEWWDSYGFNKLVPSFPSVSEALASLGVEAPPEPAMQEDDKAKFARETPDQPSAMKTGTEYPLLLRLADILRQREAPVEPVLAAVIVTGTSDIHLAASARGRRLDLLLPFHADALHAIAPGIAPPPIPPRSMLRISVDGDAIDVSLVVVGAMTPRAAVDELAASNMRDRWLQVLEPMCSVAGGGISSRTRSLTEQRATVAVRYPPRAAADDERLVQAIDQVAARLGIEDAQRALWRKIHPTLGADVVTVATQCSPAGPLPSLAFMYVITQWERAIQLTQMIANVQVARQAALALGTLAGTLQSDQTWAIELLLGEQGPDVVAWCTLRLSEPVTPKAGVAEIERRPEEPVGPKPQTGAGETAVEAIAKLAAHFANRIEKESTPGADLEEEITQPLPPLHGQMGAGQLNFGGREPPDSVRDLELRVETVSTNHGSAQLIRHGTESEVASWLRSPEAAVHIVAVMKELAAHLARKGRT